jgi:hypothetical protein
MALTSRLLLNNDLDRMWMEAVVALTDVNHKMHVWNVCVKYAVHMLTSNQLNSGFLHYSNLKTVLSFRLNIL